jgi:hypothetical protein
LVFLERGLAADAERLQVEVFAVAGRQRGARRQPVGPAAVRLPLRAQEQDRCAAALVDAFRQVVQVRHEHDPDAGLGHGADDLAGDLRAFPLVGRGEGLVAQQQAAGPHPVGDGAHLVKLLIQLAALHRGVLLAFAVREHPGADTAGQFRGRHEHARPAASAPTTAQ